MDIIIDDYYNIINFNLFDYIIETIDDSNRNNYQSILALTIMLVLIFITF